MAAKFLYTSPLMTGQRVFVRTAGKEIVIFNVNEKIYAIDDSCPHAGASLFSARLEGYLLKCPAHGLNFDIRTGCMQPGSAFRMRTYACTPVDGGIEVSMADSSQ